MMQFAGYHYEEKDGQRAAVAAIGVHPDAARHMSPALIAKYGPYKELKRFPWTVRGKKECIAFCDNYNIGNFPAEFKN